MTEKYFRIQNKALLWGFLLIIGWFLRGFFTDTKEDRVYGIELGNRVTKLETIIPMIQNTLKEIKDDIKNIKVAIKK